MNRHTTEIRVRYADTDRMGVVYYANYLVWMEVARTEYLRAEGLPYRRMEEEHGIFLPVKEAFVDYKASATYDDIVLVTSWVDAYKRVSITIAYEIANKEDGRLLATGYTLHPFIGKDGKILRTLPDEIHAVFAAEARKNDGTS